MTGENDKAINQICVDDIPQPIVALNRWTLVIGIAAALVLQQPLITTALFAVLLPATLFGRKASLIYFIGSRTFAAQNETAEREDWRLQRFNNAIATTLLGAAQLAFLSGSNWAQGAGWILSLFVATAAAIALAGFCIGCFLYYQFKLNQYKLFGQKS